MAGIDFSKFSQDFKAKFEKAIADKKIYAEEFQGFSAEDQAELSRQLASTPGHIGDIIVIQNAYKSKQGTLEFYAGADSQEGKVELSQDTISKYPNAGKFGDFNNGVVTILDKDGKVLKDSLGNPVKFDFSTDLEIDSTVDNVQGGFEAIEGENFQRTNRRFAIALIRSMYDKVIVENQKMLEQLGLLNASLWREGLGMGIQKIADSIDADQKAITATTAKKIERMVEERDKICGALEKQLDNPSGFSDEFSKLVGSNFSDMNFDKLRETCHNKENEKDDTIRYNKTVEDFNEMYPDNNVTKYLDGNFVTKSLDKMVKLCDSVADILVMFWTTGGIGGTLGKASMKGFANCSKFFIENIGKKNYKEAITQLPKLSSFMAGAAHSAPTMSAFEGGKALINSATNGEDLTADEILSRTIDGFISGAEMGVEMAGLQAFAIAPIMNKLSPVLGKMTGASSKIKELLKKNGEMSLEDISKVYEDCIQTTRGKIAQEGLHLGVSLPIMIPGFTGIDSGKAFLSNGDKSYNEDNFREQLLHNAKTQEERVRISAMNSFELKVEFVKRNFQAQLEGMTTIEGVSLALRRFQAARLAGQAVPKPVNNLLGAKIKTVEKDGKPLYEVVQENGKTLTFDMGKGGNVSQFSSPERAIAAYQAMCIKIVSEFKAELEKADNTPQPNTQGTKEQGGVRTENSGKKTYIKPEISDIEDVLPTNIAQYLKSVAKNQVLKQAGITPDIADKMRIETSGTYDSLLPSTLKMIEHFENKLAQGEKITPDDIYKAIQEFDSYWAEGGYGDKFQNLQRDLISKYWKNADKDFADKFNIAMTRTPEIMEFRTNVAQNSALKNGGITPDIATQMLRETSGTYGSLLPSTLEMIEHFENKLAKGEKITPDDIYNAIQKFDSYWAEGGYGDKFQNLQRDLISKYWKNADKDFADKFNIAMTRTPEIMEFRTNVAQNSALKNGGITPDIATQMLRETSGTYGALVPRTLDMISYLQAKIESGAKLSSILVNEAFNKFNKEYTQTGYGSEFQNLQRDLISKYWKNAGENFGKIYDVAKHLDIDTPVQEIRTEYKNAFDTIDKNVRTMGLDKIGKMSIRLKGQQSLHDKIANYLIDHPGATVTDAIKDVRDAIGARTVVESGKFANHPEVKALLDAGKEREAMLRAAELQSEPAVESLKSEILKQEQNKNHLVTARISNYVSPDGIPYLSENQLADLKQFAANHGVKLKINLRIDPSDPNFSKIDENYKPTTKSQPSGYTALQVNFITKDGKIIEWQFRGDKVNEFAEGEHIPYDLRTGKNIIGEHKELEELYNPFIDMLSEKNMNKETYKEYNRYLSDYYTHLRKLELGFDSVEPKLEDYGKGFKFDEHLSAKNLIVLHETAEKIKNKVLSVKDAINEYNSKININRIEKFAGSVQPYTDFVVKNQEKIKELNKIQDIEEFCKQSFELIKNEMGLKDSGVKLAFAKGNEGGYYDLESNTVYVNKNWNGTKCVDGQGNKAEIFGDIAHELTHHIQWIEIMRNGWFEDDLGSAYKQQLLKSKEGKYIYNYASKIGSNENSFETSMSQLWNWLNYKEPYKKGQNGFVSDRNGNPIVDENSSEYKEYINQPVEKDAFEKGEAVIKKYKELIDRS